MQTVTIAAGGTTSTAASFYQSSLAAIEVRTRNEVRSLDILGSMDGTTFNDVYSAGSKVTIAVDGDSRIYVVDPDLFRAFTQVKFKAQGAIASGCSINVLGERFTSRLRPTE